MATPCLDTYMCQLYHRESYVAYFDLQNGWTNVYVEKRVGFSVAARFYMFYLYLPLVLAIFVMFVFLVLSLPIALIVPIYSPSVHVPTSSMNRKRPLKKISVKEPLISHTLMGPRFALKVKTHFFLSNFGENLIVKLLKNHFFVIYIFFICLIYIYTLWHM